MSQPYGRAMVAPRSDQLFPEHHVGGFAPEREIRSNLPDPAAKAYSGLQYGALAAHTGLTAGVLPAKDRAPLRDTVQGAFASWDMPRAMNWTDSCL